MSEKPTYEALEQKVKSLQNECAERNRTIDLLRDSEIKYRTFFENSLDALFITRPNGQVLEANGAACEIFGYTEEELLRGGRSAVVDLDDPRLLPALKERERKGRFAGELNFKRKDGKKIPAEITTVTFKTKDGDERASIIVRDISERKKSEEALRESEAFTRTVMDHLPIGLAVNSVDPAVDFLYMNDNFPRFYRTTRKALSDPNAFWDVVYEDPVFREEIRKRVLEDCASNDRARMHWEDVPITRQGEEIAYINSRNTLVPEKSLMISTVWDVTDRKRAEDALRESETRYRSIFDYGIDGIVIIDPDTATLIDFNNQACAQLGYTREEFGCLKISDIDLLEGLEEAKAHIQKIMNIGYDEFETLHRTKDGGQRDVHVKAQYILIGGKSVYHCIWRDITDRKRAEVEKEKLQTQLLQAMKMEAVGTLAGGIAHDFNNALTGIVGFGELLRMRMAGDGQALHDLDEILRCAERASTLTRQLLTFARRQVIDPVNLNLSALVADLMKFIGKVVGEHIEVKTSLGVDVPTIHADRGQIEQVVMNLSLNARDAMPEGGRLVVETGGLHLEEEYVRQNPYMKTGRYALLTVSDTGVGMDEKTRERVFEPFFTTKGPDKGTGLGLAMVYGIVKQHDGFIHLYSEPGKGTAIKVYFPAIEAPPDAVPAMRREENVRGGTETILLAEDEEAIRVLAERILTEFGYTVLVARNGEEAIEIFRQHKEIVLAVLDVVMPRKGGKVAFDEMHTQNPRLKVIFMSGYSADAIHDSFVLIPGTPFLQKPFGPTTLARKVRDVLDTQ